MRLQTGQHDVIAIIHMGAAETRNVARAGVMSLLREGTGSNENKRNRNKKSGHLCWASAVNATMAF